MLTINGHPSRIIARALLAATLIVGGCAAWFGTQSNDYAIAVFPVVGWFETIIQV
ncbi:MAG: hypothetical protein LBV06_03195 [Propionibacteriaceae bacterium]|jgi:hypothetical protein|nr:hypothetical protein [Propionibacteriaceae bacterium]